MIEFLEYLKRPENSSYLQMLAAIVQAAAAIFSLWVAYKAISVAKQSIHSSANTRVEVTGFSMPNNNLNIKVYNTGPGIAYNVRILADMLTELEPDPLDPMLWWREARYVKTEGPRYLQPNSEQVYQMDDSALRFGLGQPFIIKYQLSSGKKMTIHMLYRKSGVVTPLTRIEILLTTWRTLRVNVRHPFMILKKKYRKWKAKRMAQKAPGEREAENNTISDDVYDSK